MFKVRMIAVALVAAMFASSVGAEETWRLNSRKASGNNSQSNSTFDESNIGTIPNATVTGGTRITNGVRTVSATGMDTSATANAQTVLFVVPRNTVSLEIMLGVGETATAIVGVSVSASAYAAEPTALGFVGFVPVTVAKPVKLTDLRVGAMGASIYGYVPTAPKVAVRILYVTQ